MIYHPKVKSQTSIVPVSGAGGFSVSVDMDVSSLEVHSPSVSALADALRKCAPKWITGMTSGLNTIKYSNPLDELSHDIHALSQTLNQHIKAEQASYRSRKNAAMRQIRQACEVDVPVFKYVRTWRVKDITFVKKVKLPVAAATHYENSGITLREGTSDYQKLLKLSANLGPFDKTRTVRITIHKTIGYWANVKTFVRNRRVIKDRRLYDKRRADWVNKNPPYSAGKDSRVAALRQQIINLKLKRSTQYNQCLAVKTAGVCGTPSECWDAAYTMLAQYLLPWGVLALGRFGSTSRLGSYSGFCAKLEYLSPGDEHTAPSWYSEFDYLDEWSRPELTITVTDKTDNRKVGQEANPLADSALSLFEEREFSVGELLPRLTMQASYDRAVLNLQAGGRNPFEWNFVRSFLEMKDTRQTVVTARDFLRQLAKGGFKAVWTVGTAAKLYLTWQYGVEPTAAEIGMLLGTSRSLLKHTYPMLRTLNAYATGVVTASVTGRQRVHLDTASLVKELFPSVWEQDLRLGDILAYTTYAEGHRRTTISATDYGILSNETETSGVNKTVPSFVWDQLEESGVSPKWVWIPEEPLVFCKYDAKNLRDKLGSGFADILQSLDVLTTAWELTPLSFVVDWFTNLRSAVSAMDDFIHADQLDLIPNGEGPWYSTRFRLCLAVPIYRKKGASRDFTVWYSSLDKVEAEMSDELGQMRATFVTPRGASVQIRARLHGVNLLKTGVTAYARDLIEDAPLLALLPDIRVSLNASKLSSILAILSSGDGSE